MEIISTITISLQNRQMVRICENNADGDITKDYAGMRAERDKNLNELKGRQIKKVEEEKELILLFIIFCLFFV